MADREDNVYKAKLAEQAERYEGNGACRSTVRRSTEKTATEKSATSGKKVHGFLVHGE